MFSFTVRHIIGATCLKAPFIRRWMCAELTHAADDITPPQLQSPIIFKLGNEYELVFMSDKGVQYAQQKRKTA